MVDWMQNVEANRAELRELNELNYARLDARLGRIETRLDGLERELHAGFARLELKIEQRFADTLKWSFVFWVGAVLTFAGAFAAMAKFWI